MSDKNELAMVEPAARGLDLSGNPLPRYAEAPRNVFGHAPPRRPGSVRRTMSIEVTWPDNVYAPSTFVGRARDVFTPLTGGDPVELAQDAISGQFDQRVIKHVEGARETAALASLAGERAGSNLRSAVDRAMHAEKAGGSTLYLLLDDLAGASLVCAWGWARWHPDFINAIRRENASFHIAQMEGVCIGFRPGSAALDVNVNDVGKRPNCTDVVSLVNPADPAGWHALTDVTDAPQFRRARLIDVWREGDVLHAWSIFQDSSNKPDSALREAIHEYRLEATADARTGELLSLKATPGTLPHSECPAAMANIGLLVGSQMTDLRDVVLEKLKRTAGCTHLNDTVRSLAEVPVLAAKLPG